MTKAKMRQLPVVPLCSIGASAGGIHALQEFFGRIDDQLGLAYVVIVHLSPEHESQLSEIIARRTRMPVFQVDSDMVLEANHVYVIPPDRELIIDGNAIKALPFTEPRGKRAPIDGFFHSAATGRGDGMAVVMSGANSDGALGVRKVKEAGGVILVQDPLEAEYGMMPRSAIATGVADFIEPIPRMVNRVAEVARSKKAIQQIEEDEAEEDLRRIVSFLRSRTGHDFSSYKRATVMRRVMRRMQVTRVDTLAAYHDYLRDNPEEAHDLFGDLLISVTAFFRDPAAFEALGEEAVRVLFDNLEDEGNLRIWSAGCATGEEAYSLAIMLLEEAERRQVSPSIQIFATDLDEAALATAREGRYPKTIDGDVTEHRLRRFFVDDGTHYRIRKELRDMVLFAHHSALKDPPFMHLDMVACRNLLIYLERDMQRQLLSLFHYALRPGGYLFLGSAESIDTTPELFAAQDREARVFKARPRAVRGVELLTQQPREHRPTIFPRMPAEGRDRTGSPPPVAHKIALEEVAPPSALVDEEQRVLNLSKNAGRYIQPPEGPISILLPELVRPELRAELRRALDRALAAREPTLTLPVNVQFESATRRVIMHVAPLTGDDRIAPQALVLFMDAGAVQTPTDAEPGTGSEGDDRLRRIEEELRTTQERLGASRREHEGAIQELRVANEELQSINEEYRLTAEELETSKEELQLINEELSTVNGELESKLDAIAAAHSDLQNLINATEIGTLFLDTDLRIKMLTPAVERLFSVTDTDIGRPISDFTHKLNLDGVEGDAARVLRDHAPIEAEVSTRDGRWLMMRLRPYLTVNGKIEGVVLSFVDISARREIEERLRESEARYRGLFDAMDEGYLLAEPLHGPGSGPADILIHDANPAARRLVRSDPIGRRLSEIAPHLDDPWFELAERVLKDGTSERRELWAKPLGRWFEVGVSRVGTSRLAIVFQDVTVRKRHTDERELMVAELNHRVKNMLAVVQSICRQTLRTTPDPEGFTEAFSQRLAALARAHGLLTQDHWGGSDLRELATSVLDSFAHGTRRIRMDGPALRVPPNASISLAMALHELATNAMKYGALSTPSGKIALSWMQDDRGLHVAWNETGGPAVIPPTRKGFGGRMLASVARELGGELELDFAPQGVNCRISFPLERTATIAQD
ncbi:CheR family methyltransferase [Cereibacter sp. SYSU M97828]|nr:CheR family methyltransferase [Cereibacter flavus]